MIYPTLFAANLDKALWIMLRGLLVVFLVMGLIAGAMWLSGKFFIAKQQKELARQKAEQEQKKAEEMGLVATTKGDA